MSRSINTLCSLLRILRLNRLDMVPSRVFSASLSLSSGLSNSNICSFGSDRILSLRLLEIRPNQSTCARTYHNSTKFLDHKVYSLSVLKAKLTTDKYYPRNSSHNISHYGIFLLVFLGHPFYTLFYFLNNPWYTYGLISGSAIRFLLNVIKVAMSVHCTGISSRCNSSRDINGLSFVNWHSG